jgi:dipeptidyl aminopeptidase/acylaminoacyl peptidase
MTTIVQHDLPHLGHAYAPPGEGPFPAVLLLHGSEGSRGWIAHRDAAILAASGFLAYPHPYSAGDLPWIGGDIWMTPLDATETAFVRLRESPLCNGKVGVYGWSRGAEHALLVAALTAEDGSLNRPHAVAAHAPPDRVMTAWRNTFARVPDEPGRRTPPAEWLWQSKLHDPSLSAWTWRGSPLPGGAPLTIERFDGPIFLSVGDRDEIWPSEMTTRLDARLRSAGRLPETHIYAGQRHMPDPETWNRHLNLIVQFFDRHLPKPGELID